MDIRRSIICSLWTDEWIESLSVQEKLLFIYLLTCPLSNILGIYKISVNRMCFETGLTNETVQKALERFQKDKKVLYLSGYIIIVNHLKHQKLNPNMKINVMSDYNELPNELIDKLKTNDPKDFESLSNALQTLSKIEIEIEIEIGNLKGNGKNPAEPPVSKLDFIDILLDDFCNEYYLSRETHFDLTSKFKERSAIGKLLTMYRQKNPNSNTETARMQFNDIFKKCLEVKDKFYYNGMSPSIILSQWNALKIIINGKKSDKFDPKWLEGAVSGSGKQN